MRPPSYYCKPHYNRITLNSALRLAGVQVGHRIAGVARRPLRPERLLAAPLHERETRRDPQPGKC